MSFVSHTLHTLRGDFLSPAGYFFIGWVATYILIGTVVHLLENRQAPRPAAHRLIQGVKYCVPKDKLLSPSARLDFKIFFFNHYLFYFLIFVITGGAAFEGNIAAHVTHGLTFLGIHFKGYNGFWIDLIYTILVLAIADLGWTVQHILFHKIPWLWEFHKVHHSAKDLNIFTIARLHPFDALTQGWASAITVGVFMGLVHVFLGYQPSLVLFLNVSVAMAAFRILGIFRHSHIWISFGPVISRIFSSPAMHQIHHSVERRHWDKNFAVVFSFWDWLFGTLYLAHTKEEFKLGIEAHPYRNYDSFWGCLLHPMLPDRPKKLEYVQK